MQMSVIRKAAREFVPILLTALLVACGGGGGGGSAKVPPPAGGGGGSGGGSTGSKLDPATAVLSRYYQEGLDFTFPYPDFWGRVLVNGSAGGTAIRFEQPHYAADPFREYITITAVAPGSKTLPDEISNIQQVSADNFAIRDLDATESIFDADYAGVTAVQLRFLETEFTVNNMTFSILFVGERGELSRVDDGFNDYLPLVRYMIRKFTIGLTVEEVDWLLDPGRSAVATDGSRFLTIVCHDESRQSFFSSSLDAVFVQPGANRVGTEFQVDTQGIACGSTSPSVTWDGTNFLVTYIREVSFPLVRNGQIVQNDQMTVVGKRISPDGQILDADPIIISTEGSDQETNIFAGKPANDSTSTFDGSRHFVVWEQAMNLDVYDFDHLRQIHGAFVDPDGTVSQNFVVFDRINGQYGPTRYAFWRPDVAAGTDRLMVVWGPRSEPTTKAEPRPVYAQFVDLSGVNLFPNPILIRSDDGNVQPRYPQVAFGGQDFVVAWIQGEQSSTATNGGLYGIFARRVSPSGQLQNGDADSDGFEVMPEAEQDREFLELKRSGSEFLALWGVIGFTPEDGIWGTRFSRDLASVKSAQLVWGAGTDAIPNTIPIAEHLAVAAGDPRSLVVWTSYNFVKGWFLEPGFPDSP